MKASLGAVAAALGGTMLRRDEAEAHGALHVETTEAPAIHGVSRAEEEEDAIGIIGDGGPAGIGVIGFGEERGTGVFGLASHGIGMRGVGGYAGVIGTGQLWGLRGEGSDHGGVLGSGNVFGVVGGGPFVGVRGVASRLQGEVGEPFPTTDKSFGIGVEALHPAGGVALSVVGMARFTTAGNATITPGQASQFVATDAVTASSHITVTLTSNPGPPPSSGNPNSKQPPGQLVVVHWIERVPSEGFTVHLSGAVANATSFSYLVVEPPLQV